MLEHALVKPLVWLYYLLSPLWFTKGLQLCSTYTAAPPSPAPDWVLIYHFTHYTEIKHGLRTFPVTKASTMNLFRMAWQNQSAYPPTLTHCWASQFDDVPQIMSRQNCEIKLGKWCFLTIRKHSIGFSFYDASVVWLKFGSKPYAYSGCYLILGEEMNKI